MITINAKIDIMRGKLANIKSSDSNIVGINVSPSIGSVIGKKMQPNIKPFMLGKSKLGAGNYYISQLPYIVGRELANENGEFTNSYTISITSYQILEQIIIVFDTINRTHPNSIIVDGKTYIDDDPQFEIVFREKKITHTITINNWNTPNTPLIITSIYANANIEIDRKTLLHYDSSIFDRSNINYPSYGIMSNGGSITLADYDEQILDLITQKILHSGISVEVFLTNTLTDKSEQLAKLSITELKYDNDNRSVDLQLKDSLEEWQELNVEAIYYNPAKPTTQNCKWLYDYLYSKTPQKYSMLSFIELDKETKNILTNTIIQYPLLESDNLWNEWDKLCQLCHLNIFVNESGRTICKSNRYITSIKKTATIEIIESLREDSNIAFYAVSLIYGVLEIGNTIIYKNDIAEVTDYREEDDLYEIRASSIGYISNEIGNIITVTIVE